MTDFEQIMGDADRELKALEEKDNGRWKSRSAVDLRRKLIEEFHAWNGCVPKNGTEYGELLHMMNSIRRLAWKLKEMEER